MLELEQYGNLPLKCSEGERRLERERERERENVEDGLYTTQYLLFLFFSLSIYV
jgi:hypothetical protein